MNLRYWSGSCEIQLANGVIAGILKVDLIQKTALDFDSEIDVSLVSSHDFLKFIVPFYRTSQSELHFDISYWETYHLNHPISKEVPVIGVNKGEAIAYGLHLGKRLPTISELLFFYLSAKIRAEDCDLELLSSSLSNVARDSEFCEVNTYKEWIDPNQAIDYQLVVPNGAPESKILSDNATYLSSVRCDGNTVIFDIASCSQMVCRRQGWTARRSDTAFRLVSE